MDHWETRDGKENLAEKGNGRQFEWQDRELESLCSALLTSLIIHALT